MSEFFQSEAFQNALDILIHQFPLAIWETVYVTLLSTFFAIVLGLPLGVLLVAGENNRILHVPQWLLRVLNVIINLLRSVPFLILMILVFPLTRLIVGTVVGTPASIVPLVIASISGSEKIKRNLFLRPTNVDLSILDVVPADKVKEMSTNELADYSRGLIERSLPKAVKEAV